MRLDGAVLDAIPLSPGQTRRLCSGIARHFVQHGVPDERGLLTLGWYDTFLPTTQQYSGPGSPYWASKGFIGLVLPPDHPVWTAPEDSIPLDDADQVRAMPAPGWIVHASGHDQIVQLVNHGADHAPVAEPEGVEPEGDPHYNRLCVPQPRRAGPVRPRAAHRQPHLARRRGRPVQLGAGGSGGSRARADGRRPRGTRRGSARTDRGASRRRRSCTAAGRSGVRWSKDRPGLMVRSGGFAVAGESSLKATAVGRASSVRNLDDVVSAVVGLHGVRRSRRPPGSGGRTRSACTRRRRT